MSFDCPAPVEADRLRPGVAALLEIATARLCRQKQYARVLSAGGGGAEALRDGLHQATGCITALARPEALFVPVAARRAAGGLRLADRVTLRGTDLARDLDRGGRVTAYLLTLNYSQSAAFDRLGRDYFVHHVQSELGREVLFALGRAAHGHMRAGVASGRLRMVPILANAQCGQRRVWDPADVRALLTCFDGVNPGVQITETGCFNPLNALLGLALSSPDR